MTQRAIAETKVCILTASEQEAAMLIWDQCGDGNTAGGEDFNICQNEGSAQRRNQALCILSENMTTLHHLLIM